MAKTVKLTTLSCEDLAKLAEIGQLRDLAIQAMRVKGCPIGRKVE